MVGHAPPYTAMIVNVIKHRKLVWDFVVRDYKGRFAGSILGFCWSVIHPLVLIVIYTVIFSMIMSSRFKGGGYSVYLCAGIIPWFAFAEVLGRSTSIYLEHSNLIKKMVFPEEILNAHIVIIGSINFAIMFSMYLVFLLIVRHPISPYLLLVIPIFLMQMLFAYSLGIACATLTVFFRDVAQIMTVVLQLWFWGTPIIYTMGDVPVVVQTIVKLNPMYYFIESYHSIIVERRCPDISHLVIAAAIVAVSFGFGKVVFAKLKNDIPDEI